MREYSILTHRDNVDIGAVVTTSSFDSKAQDEAKIAGLKLIDGQDLVDLIIQTSAIEILREAVASHSQVGDIHGIGTESVDVLGEAGIHTIAELAAIDVMAVAEQTSLSPSELHRWKSQAAYREDQPVRTVPGIGEKYSAELRKENVVTIGDLAAVNPSELAAETEIPEHKLAKASEYASNRPKEPPDVITGIGDTYASELADAGLTTIGQLAYADPERVADEISVDEQIVAGWRERA